MKVLKYRIVIFKLCLCVEVKVLKYRIVIFKLCLCVEVKVLKYRIVIFKLCLCLCAAGRLLLRRRRRKKRRVKRAVKRWLWPFIALSFVVRGGGGGGLLQFSFLHMYALKIQMCTTAPTLPWEKATFTCEFSCVCGCVHCTHMPACIHATHTPPSLHTLKQKCENSTYELRHKDSWCELVPVAVCMCVCSGGGWGELSTSWTTERKHWVQRWGQSEGNTGVSSTAHAVH